MNTRARPSGARARPRATSSDLLSKRDFVIVLRALLCVAATAMTISAAMVFEAARATATGIRAAQTALAAPDVDARASGLMEAAEAVEASWAQPREWHAGAQEVLSWSYGVLAAQVPESDFVQRSINAAQRSVFRSPLQAPAWARLAQFSAGGMPNALCDATTCLERSWEAVELAPLSTYCARLRLGAELGLVHGATDERVLALTRVHVLPDSLMNCVSFLGQEEMFSVMLAQQAESAARMEAARQTGRSPFTRPYH